MSALALIDPADRVRRTVHNALDGATFESSTFEPGDMLVIQARRPDGSLVGLRFRAVKQSDASAEPEQGSSLRLRGVQSGSRLGALRLILPMFRDPLVGYARVRIDAGEVRLDIVCQDAEWWQVEPPKGGQA